MALELNITLEDGSQVWMTAIVDGLTPQEWLRAAFAQHGVEKVLNNFRDQSDYLNRDENEFVAPIEGLPVVFAGEGDGDYKMFVYDDGTIISG